MGSNQCWTEEEIEILKREFPTKWTSIPILRRTRQAIQGKATNLGIKTENRLWTKEEIICLRRDYYLKGSKALPNRPRNSVKKYAQKMNLKFFRDTPNLKFFKILTPTSAYVIGFIWADGSLRNKTVRIDQSKPEILRKILDRMKSQQRIKTYHRKMCNTIDYYITFSQQQIAKDLIALGLHQNKSHTIKFPKNFPIKLMSHFIRGYFDGNGSIWWHKRECNFNASFSCGSVFLINQISKIFTDFSHHVQDLHRNCWGLRIRKKSLISFGNWMYKDSTIHLDRKYQKFKLAGCDI